MHVVQAPRVRTLLTNLMCVMLPRVERIPFEPGKVPELSFVVAETETCRGPSSARILPLGFRRQRVLPVGRQTLRRTLKSRQLPTELHRIIPVHIRGRTVRFFAHVDLSLPGSGLHHRLPLTLCDFVFPQPEAPCQRHLDLVFIAFSARFIRRRAHRETAWLTPHQFQIQALVVPLFTSQFALLQRPGRLRGDPLDW